MSISLKASNAIALHVVLLANVVAYLALARWGGAVVDDPSKLLDIWKMAVPVTLGAVITGVLNAQLSATTKARLVFFRWSDPLPGSEAFTRHGPADHRIDMKRIAATFGPIPTDKREQNALWYRLYKSVADENSVSQVHRSFLFARDYATLAFLFLLVGGTLCFFQMTPHSLAVWYFVALVTQFILVARAARVHGRRFVTTVLALKSAE